MVAGTWVEGDSGGLPDARLIHKRPGGRGCASPNPEGMKTRALAPSQSNRFVKKPVLLGDGLPVQTPHAASSSFADAASGAHRLVRSPRVVAIYPRLQSITAHRFIGWIVLAPVSVSRATRALNSGSFLRLSGCHLRWSLGLCGYAPPPVSCRLTSGPIFGGHPALPNGSMRRPKRFSK